LIVGLIVLVIVNYIASNKGLNEKSNATYVSTYDSDVEIELTKDDEIIDEALTHHIAYLHADGKTYKGYYYIITQSIWDRQLALTFEYEVSDDYPDGIIDEYFKIKGKKLEIQNVSVMKQVNLFANNRYFVKKTWWNTWGRKTIIILIILGGICVLKDALSGSKIKN
jgi:hypothetical protein